jgi:phosphoglucosamine mutase
MSNIGLHKAMADFGITVLQANVGDRYVLEEMQKGGYNLGGEQSGHIILLDKNTTGDGILTGLLLSEIYKEAKIKMSELTSIMYTYPQVLVNAKVPCDKKHSYNENITIKNAIKKIEEEFHGNGRVLIRPSGTENLVRVMLEGSDKEMMLKKAKELADLIEEELNQIPA